MCVCVCVCVCVYMCVYIHVNETMMDDSTIGVTLPASRVSVL